MRFSSKGRDTCRLGAESFPVRKGSGDRDDNCAGGIDILEVGGECPVEKKFGGRVELIGDENHVSGRGEEGR